MVRIDNVRELEIALSYFNDEGAFIDLRGLALVWDWDGVTIYEVPLEVWRSKGSPVRKEWNGRWS